MREKYERRFCWRRLICALLIAVLAFSADWIPCAQNDAYAASDGMIRVYLTRLGSPSSIHLTPQCDYVLMVDDGYAVPAGTAVYVQAAGGSLTVTCGDWQIACGSSVRLTRTQGGNRGVRFTSPSLANLFSGDLTFYASGNAINTVLSIYIEDYLCGVVAYEMSDSYPLEALKAQAVAARNYALRQKSARGSSYYDVTDNTSNQVFKGYNASYGNVINAVRGTAGLTLYAGSALASCYYTASNGGQTESTKNAWGNALSYSVVKDDPYDLQSAGKKKTAAIRRDASGLHEKLAAALRAGTAPALNAAGLAGAQVEIQSINAITPHNPKYASPSRLYRTLTFNITVSAQASGKSAQLTCDVDIPTYGAFESWYDLSINSGSNETIAVEAGADAFTVTFRRWGHGIGMSQRGAQVMARDYGASCGQILEFYYPGTTRRTLSLSDTGGGAHAGSAYPTPEPSESPTPEPTASPTLEPTATATIEPTASPTLEPTATATIEPTADPTVKPMATATIEPTADPTVKPTATATIEPSATPAFLPTARPTPTPGATLPIFGDDTPAPTLPDLTVKPTRTPSPTLPIFTPAPTIAPTSTPKSTEINRYMYVNVSSGSSLALRSAPSLNGRVLARLKRGTRVYARTLSNDWYYVTTEGGQNGYVAKRYLTAAAVATPAPTKAPTKRAVTPIIDDCTPKDTNVTFCNVYAVTTTAVRVRKSNSTSSASLGTLPAGVTVQVGAFDATWAYICLNGRYGFVQHKYLRIVN